MADIEYCAACEELRRKDPNLIANGFSDENCTHMDLDEGLTGDTNDCEDLNTMNDCLVGRMDDEADVHDVCDWQKYMHELIPNLWTMFKAIICSICGLWTTVHSFELTKTGNRICLNARDGNHGCITDENDNTTYDLVKSGSTITLVGSDGTRDNVTDDNTKYDLTKTGNQIKLTGTDGTVDSITDSDTRYSLSGNGSNVILTGTDGTSTSYAVPPTDLSGIRQELSNLRELIDSIEDQLVYSSYMGILTLLSSEKVYGDGSTVQVVPFDRNRRQGNIDTAVLSVGSDYKSINVNNTTQIDLLVESTYNCSMSTEQNFACCYILITKDDKAIGQTPFITPNTYDQQVMSEPFILHPGESATLAYEFRIGAKNSWFQNHFGYIQGGSGNPVCTHDALSDPDPRHQSSYFSVRVTSIVDEQ